MRSKAAVLFLAAATAGAAGARAAEPLAVHPSETDRRITHWDSPHLAWLPEGTPRNQLLVFLPGTGGAPGKAESSHTFAETATALGYHVVSLMYPDNMAAQIACGNSADPDAHLKFRNAILRGGMETPRRRIEPWDSIESRLERLIVYLKTRQPDRGWEKYLAPGGGIHWRAVAVSGLSQGGGHSYMLGKNHELARILMFGSPKDFSFHFGRPAKGFDSRTKTPPTRFFAYNHVRDNGNGCNHDQQKRILQQIGLTNLGVAEVDGAAPPFGHARVLYTNADIGHSTKFHGSVLGGKIRANPAVWKYMLSEPAD